MTSWQLHVIKLNNFDNCIIYAVIIPMKDKQRNSIGVRIIYLLLVREGKNNNYNNGIIGTTKKRVNF